MMRFFWLLLALILVGCSATTINAPLLPGETPTAIPMVDQQDVRVSCPGDLTYTAAQPVSDLLCVGYTPTPTATDTATSTATETVQPTATVTPTPTPRGPIAAAFLYPWFPGSWTQGGGYPYTQYHPSLGFYDSSDFAIVDQQLDLAQGAHLQAFIASWWGQGSLTDQAIQTIVPHAATTHPAFQWSLYYEPEGQGDPSVSQIGADLAYLTPLFNGPNYLHVNGAPVLFVYADGADGSGMASRWVQARAAYGQPLYVVLKVYPGYKSDPNQPQSWHQYGPAVAYSPQLPYAVSVSPGFYKSGEASPRLNRDPVAFASNISKMVNAKPTWELVTTWNEWGEGTAVEPASEFGTVYLSALCAALPGTTPCAPSPTAVSSQTSTNTPTPEPTQTPTLTETPSGVPATVSPSSTATATPTTSPTNLPTGTATGTPTASSTPLRTPTRTPTRTVTAVVGTVPSFTHVYVLLMENEESGSIVGSSNAPYLNNLIGSYGLATNYNGVAHPSEPNYLALFSGSTQGVTDDGTYNLSGTNLADQLEAHGKTWRVYAQNVPLNCSKVSTASGGEDGAGNYARKHEPAISFTDISLNPSRCANISDFTHFDASAADYTFIAPNLCNDMHDCSVKTGDTFLQGWLPSHILTTIAWGQGLNVLFIVWDEGTTSTGGGGHVASIVVSNDLISAGMKSGTPHNHYSLLRTIEDAWGLGCLAQTCSANNLAEFFR